MRWSMRYPTFKSGLFRLIDALPSLRSPRDIAVHANHYLGAEIAVLPLPRFLQAMLRMIISAPHNSIRALDLGYGIRAGARQMASLFIPGESVARAEKRLQTLRRQRLAFTLDLLGEYCVSENEAEQYLERYLTCLVQLAESAGRWDNLAQPIIPGHRGEASPICLSVKLSALYSQCSPLNFEESIKVLSARLSRIVAACERCGASLYIDAEDSTTNPIIYDTFKNVFGSQRFRRFPLPGIVVQTYLQNSASILQDLLSFARERGSPIALRLVKGAYWDQECIRSQQNGSPCPVFRLKRETDAQFETLACRILSSTSLCLPAFASHNVRSLAKACCYAKSIGVPPSHFELQTLFGMAEPISLAFRDQGYLVRVYVPLGNAEVGMGYFVRRLLENTSNESFLRHTFFEAEAIEHLLKAPL